MPPRARRVLRAVVRPRRRIRLDNDARRAQLLELAKKAFSDRSYDDVSIDDLAREAKISKGLLYHYFPTKRDLYVAGLREIADELVERVTKVPQDLAPIDRVKASLDGYLDFVEQHSRAFVSLMRGGIGSDPEVAQVIEDVRTRLFDSFLSEAPFAAMLTKDGTFQTAVRGWLGFVEGASLDWCVNARLDRAALRDMMSKVLFAILQAILPGMSL